MRLSAFTSNRNGLVEDPVAELETEKLRAGPARRMMAISTETEAEAEVSKALKEGDVHRGRTSAKRRRRWSSSSSSSSTTRGLPGVWGGRNAIAGRWTMFGGAYATGVDFIDQRSDVYMTGGALTDGRAGPGGPNGRRGEPMPMFPNT